MESSINALYLKWGQTMEKGDKVPDSVWLQRDFVSFVMIIHPNAL